MRCELKRISYGSSGIFSELSVCDSGIFYTIERSYPNPNNEWGYSSKVPPGDYYCVKCIPEGKKYETFKLRDVPKFRNEDVGEIMFKIANFQSDVNGDIGIGMKMRLEYPAMVEASRAAHKEFMKLQKNVDGFILSIT